MIRGIDLHYRAMRHYQRAIFRGDHQAVIMWAFVLDRQAKIMRDGKRLRIVFKQHQSKQKKSRRRNRRMRSRSAP